MYEWQQRKNITSSFEANGTPCMDHSSIEKTHFPAIKDMRDLRWDDKDRYSVKFCESRI